MSDYMASKKGWIMFAGALVLALGILFVGLYEPSPKEATAPVPRIAPLVRIDGFQPHRALYSIKMTSQKDSSALVNLTGQLAYEWRPDCDGVLTNYHFDMRYDYNAAPSVSLRTHISNYELFSGGLEFVMQRYIDGEEAVYMQGMVDPYTANVVFDNEDKPEMPLPEGVLFPTSHMQGLINAVRENKTTYFAYLFDGSEEQGALAVNALIGQSVDPLYKVDRENKKIDLDALKAPARKVILAFYPEDQAQQATPDYEMHAIFHENGVMRNLDITYDTFSVSQDLVSLEILENQCR